ncbi:MAG: GFA family protein [Myxococcota bacterium]
MTLHTYEGGCHCGAVRFRISVKERRALDCNCSICFKKGFLHVIASKKNFCLLDGQASLHTYTFNTHVAKHHFCNHCGISPFYLPRSHPDGVSANLRCFDGDVLGLFTIETFDGQNWESNIDSIR